MCCDADVTFWEREDTLQKLAICFAGLCDEANVSGKNKGIDGKWVKTSMGNGNDVVEIDRGKGETFEILITEKGNEKTRL